MTCGCQKCIAIDKKHKKTYQFGEDSAILQHDTKQMVYEVDFSNSFINRAEEEIEDILDVKMTGFTYHLVISMRKMEVSGLQTWVFVVLAANLVVICILCVICSILFLVCLCCCLSCLVICGVISGIVATRVRRLQKMKKFRKLIENDKGQELNDKDGFFKFFKLNQQLLIANLEDLELIEEIGRGTSGYFNSSFFFCKFLLQILCTK